MEQTKNANPPRAAKYDALGNVVGLQTPEGYLVRGSFDSDWYNQDTDQKGQLVDGHFRAGSPSPHTVTDEDVDDILTTAFEGGIGYWCSEVNVINGDFHGAKYASHAVSKGATVRLKLHPEEAGDDEPNLLDAKAIRKGIRKAAEHAGKTVRAFMDNHDAGDADNAVQFAVFGKLIYG